MLPADSPEMLLREEIRKKLEEAIRKRFRTQKEAAHGLGVDPARLNIYLKKKATPSAFFLLTACKRWGLRIEFDGTEFRARTLPSKSRPARSGPEQLPLFNALKELENHDLGVRIQRKALDRLELNVEIRFAS